MLKNSHDKVKKLLDLCFYVFEMQFIPSRRSTVLDYGRLLILLIILAFSAFCNIWHFLYQVKSLDNILDISVNNQCFIAAVQAIFTVTIVIIGLKRKHLEVQRYFERIVVSSEEFISEAREEHLSKSLDVAITITRFFSTFFLPTCLLFPIFALHQTNYISPLYYTFPGIPSTSLFFYPVNIFGQFFLYIYLVVLYIAMDSLFLIYLFYFRGEICSIMAVSEKLSYKENLGLHCKMLAISLLFIVCTPGQLIDNCSEELRETLYKTLWYEMKPKDQRNFLLIFKGAQRNIKAETMGIDKISFSTLVQGIKTAISYAAFVYTVLL
ncbi:hypothetical protein DMENIID0001_054620 [Sergentomyia squamirostris]